MSHSDGKVIRDAITAKTLENLINACLFNEKPLPASFQYETMKLDSEKNPIAMDYENPELKVEYC